MTTSAHATFDQLTEAVKQAEAEIRSSASRNRDQLQARVEQARTGAEQRASQIQTKATQARGDAAAGWQSMKEKWQAHVSDLHDKAAGKKAELDQKKMARRADAADDYADDAVSFAIAAVQEAEYAVLDAALARADAQAASTG
jgi:hypothetical protein